MKIWVKRGGTAVLPLMICIFSASASLAKAQEGEETSARVQVPALTQVQTEVQTMVQTEVQTEVSVPKITVDSIFQSAEFKVQTLRGMENLLEEKEYYKLEKGALVKHTRLKKNKEKTEVLVEPVKAADNSFSDIKWWPTDFAFNADKSRVLLLSDRKAIYRRSATYEAVVWMRDAKGRYGSPVVLSEDGPIQEPLFSPDGEKIAFIRDNNIYYYDFATKRFETVTTDGKINEIRNGHTDWVYEEEFGFTRAYAWRPDSRQIAYLRFDESALREYEMTVWGELYPETYRYKYPKAGEENSKVSIMLYKVERGADVRDERTVEVALAGDSIEYIPRIFWNPTGSQLICYSLNRHQNHFRLWGVDTGSLAQNVIYEERDRAYVEVGDDIYFFKDGRRMLIAGGKDGYNHLWLYRTDGKDRKGICLTPGAYDVTALYGVDEARNRVFYQAAYSSPQNRDLMCVNLDGTRLRRPAYDMQVKGGSTYARFNNDFSYMILEHSTANTPSSYYLYHLGDDSEQLIECLLSNHNFEHLAKKYNFVRKTFVRYPVPFIEREDNEFMRDENFGKHRADPPAAVESENLYLQAWVMQPSEIGTPEAEGRQYPVLMFLYGGPGSQQVTNSLRPNAVRDYLFYQMLVQNGYIVVCVDNRGTGGRGEAFKKCTYMQLGRYETDDQVEAAIFLSSLPYVDRNRIGIWGWSYGGFMSTNCLFHADEVFKAAAAVAPVTNWKYYDNVYTERYMRTPAENPDGYELGSPLNYAENLRGAYLLVHGTGDDNVHIQNSMELMSALQKAGKPFDLMVYPNKNHSMIGADGSAQQHLYNKLAKFILENL